MIKRPEGSFLILFCILMVLLYNKNTGGEQIEKTDVYYISYCFGYYFSGCFVLYVVCSYSILSISSWFR